MSYTPATLVGKAIGDALGKAFETMSPNNELLLNWDGKTFLASEHHKLGATQWTDDTLMAKSIAESLVICGGFYPRDIADRYHAWFRTGKFRGMGNSTRKALTKLDEKVPWTKSGTKNAEGNGTAMRVAPLGLFFHEDLQTVATFAKIDARITHQSTEADVGAIAIGIAIALLFQNQTKDGLLSLVCSHLPPSKIKVQLEKLKDIQLEKLPEEFRSAAGLTQVFGTKAHVVETVPTAFAILLHTSSFEESIETAIRAGGDTDTTAAIVGALAGTLYGLESIPKMWHTVEDFQHLKRLDARLAKGPRSEALWLRS